MIPTLVVDAVAAYRLTRLVTDDEILHRQREAFIARTYRWASPAENAVDAGILTGGTWTETAIVDTADHAAPKLATLVTCRWCAGIWIGFGVVAARRLAPRAWAPVAEALSVAAAAALLAGFEE